MPFVSRNTKRLTWPAALDLYETYLCSRRASPLTVAGHLGDLTLFQTWLRSRRLEITTPADVTLQDLRDYQVGLLTGDASHSGRKLTAGTVANVSTTLRRFFVFLADEGRIPSNPSARLDRPKLSQKAPGEVLSPKEVGKILRAADRTTPLGLRDRALLEILYATGLRNAEACNLDLADLDHQEREVVVRSGKGDKGRIVPLTRSAYEHVAAYLERARPTLASSHADSASALFLTFTGRRFNGMTIKQVLRRLLRVAGIKKHVTPHTVRRSFATSLLKGGVSLRHIQALLGHASLNTTATYLRLDTAELRREILLKHPRERLDV